MSLDISATYGPEESFTPQRIRRSRKTIKQPPQTDNRLSLKKSARVRSGIFWRKSEVDSQQSKITKFLHKNEHQIDHQSAPEDNLDQSGAESIDKFKELEARLKAKELEVLNLKSKY
jgi:hypothetical protein